MLVTEPKIAPEGHLHGKQGGDKMRPLRVAKGLAALRSAYYARRAVSEGKEFMRSFADQIGQSSTQKSITGGALAALRKASHRGEGTRGGHIIGHTRSGKPIYASTSSKYGKLRHAEPGAEVKTDLWNAKRTRAAYPKFSVEDHDDAIEAHAKNYFHHDAGARQARDSGHHKAARAHDDLADIHEAAWEGHKRAKLNMRDEGHDYPDRAYHTAAGGAEIHDLGHPLYAGISNASVHADKDAIARNMSRVNNRDRIKTLFGHYTPEDHKAAVRHHTDLAQATRHQILNASRQPFSSVSAGRRAAMAQNIMQHESVAQAHQDYLNKFHPEHGEFGKSVADTDDSLVRLRKAAKRGEGSHGGHIIGHTKSGKPVYAAGPKGVSRTFHIRYKGFSPEDHGDAVDVHDRVADEAIRSGRSNDATDIPYHRMVHSVLADGATMTPAEHRDTADLYRLYAKRGMGRARYSQSRIAPNVAADESRAAQAYAMMADYHEKKAGG